MPAFETCACRTDVISCDHRHLTVPRTIPTQLCIVNYSCTPSMDKYKTAFRSLANRRLSCSWLVGRIPTMVFGTFRGRCRGLFPRRCRAPPLLVIVTVTMRAHANKGGQTHRILGQVKDAVSRWYMPSYNTFYFIAVHQKSSKVATSPTAFPSCWRPIQSCTGIGEVSIH